VLVALAEKVQSCRSTPSAVGETAQDLQPFDPQDFARSLMGLAGGGSFSLI